MALTPLNFSDLSFIIVDDEPESLRAMENVLKNAKAKMVHNCTTSKAALDILNNLNK